MSLAVSLRGRGAAGSAARTAMVLSRFGATAAAMARRLERYRAITSAFGARPSWPTTACVLARHPGLLRRYAEEGADLAVHGLVHGDHIALDHARQRETIARAVAIFRSCGIEAVGFRGPYLRYNAATLDVLRELGFRYHSSQAVSFPLVDGDPAQSDAPNYYRALELYSAQDVRRVAVRPRLLEGLVDIPVAIPDDEILVERLRLDDAARAAQWLQMLDLTYERGDLFTLQLHPERIDELGDALAATLSEARRRRPQVFVGRLDEIASWWLRRSSFRLRVTRMPDHRSHVSLEADPAATLLVRGLDVPRTAWHGQDAISRSFDFEARAERLPVIAVSPRSPVAVRLFLEEEGFPVEISDEAHDYGAYVDVSSDWTEAGVLDAIERAPGPLVRVWRWPDGARSAFAATGDIDALTLRDFVMRSWETRHYNAGRSHP